jgi:hypothetical protein
VAGDIVVADDRVLMRSRVLTDETSEPPEPTSCNDDWVPEDVDGRHRATR